VARPLTLMTAILGVNGPSDPRAGVTHVDRAAALPGPFRAGCAQAGRAWTR